MGLRIRRDWRLGNIVGAGCKDYTAAMNKLNSLLDRLKARQRDLIMQAAEHDTMPADSVLKGIAELENVIAAVEAVADEEANQGRS